MILLTVGDVPLESSWWISDCVAHRYFEPNDLDASPLNNIMAQRAAYGTITVRSGGLNG